LPVVDSIFYRFPNITWFIEGSIYFEERKETKGRIVKYNCTRNI